MSDKTRELAKQIATEFLLNYKTVDIKRLAALLDAFERETRLDEAKWWRDYVGCEERELYKAYLDRRIAELAAQPTPEVKK